MKSGRTFIKKVNGKQSPCTGECYMCHGCMVYGLSGLAALTYEKENNFTTLVTNYFFVLEKKYRK